MDKQQGPAVQQGNNIQYPEINHSGKEYEKEFVFHNSLSTDSHSHTVGQCARADSDFHLNTA